MLSICEFFGLVCVAFVPLVLFGLWLERNHGDDRYK